jgi:site-specific recombinase XerD
MYEAAARWLKTKYDAKSQSPKTMKAYKTTLADFDTHLQAQGYHLDGDSRRVALEIQAWSVTSKTGKQVSTGTINQRIAILSSFYDYAVKYGACEHNPVNYCERPKRIVKDVKGCAIWPYYGWPW